MKSALLAIGSELRERLSQDTKVPHHAPNKCGAVQLEFLASLQLFTTLLVCAVLEIQKVLMAKQRQQSTHAT